MAEPNPTLVQLSNVRLSFPHIAEPQKNKNEKTQEERISYNAEFLLTPNHPGWARFHQVVLEMATAKWKEMAGGVISFCDANRKNRCYGGGEEKIKQSTMKPYPGYEGMVFISAGKDKMPQIFDAQGNQINPLDTMACQQEARRMYGGCWVNASVRPWMQDHKEHGKAVRCDFVAIQFLRDDTPFGEGAVDASAHFGAVEGAPVTSAPQWVTPTTMPPAPFPGAQPPAAAPSWAAPQAPAPAPAWAPPTTPAKLPWM